MDHILKSIQEMRRSKEMCDVLVTSSSGREHHAHGVILAASSAVLKVMVTHEFQEFLSKTINLSGVSDEMVELLLDYIYGKKVELNNENVMEIFELADMLELQALMSDCLDFIVKHMDFSNCLGILRLADQFSHTALYTRTSAFILQQFEKFMEHEDFYRLSAREMRHFLDHDELNVQKEEQVLECIITWCQHEASREKDLKGVLQCVRFRQIPSERLKVTLTSNGVFKSDEATLEFTREIIDCCAKHQAPGDKTFRCLTKPHRIPHQAILLIGGWNRGRTLDLVECYNRNLKTWSVCKQLKDPAGGRCYFGLEVLRQDVFMIGGYDGKFYLNTVRRFDLKNKTWTDAASLHIRRCFASAVEFNGALYVIAGFDGNRRLQSVERYSVERRQWNLMKSINTPRSDATAVVHNGKIYLIGGFAGDSLSSCELYNSSEDSWTYIMPMICKRSGATAISLGEHDKIFVLGGYNGTNRMYTTEFYDPIENTWSLGPPMKHERSNFATCIMGNILYVIGGYTGHKTLDEVERFDVVKLTWCASERINCPRSAMRAVLVEGIANIKDYFLPDVSPPTEITPREALLNDINTRGGNTIHNDRQR